MQKSMETDENKKSESAQREESTLAFWEREQIFQKTLEKESPNGEFVFFEGPPTANGRPGLHHVAARSFKDIIPRYKTMRGYRVRRKAGWDTHGLPVELQVEKALGLKSKKDIEQYGVEQFNQKCKESVWEYKTEWEQLTNRMGFWLDTTDPYITYKNSYIEALWGVVKRADERAHLYRDFRVVPWCTRCGTGLSSHELNQPGAYKDVKDLSIYAKFKIIGFDKAYFLAWTTTPWTLPGNVALAVGNDIDYVEAKVGDEILVLAKERVSILPEGYEIIAEHKGSEMVGMQYEPLYPYMQELTSGDQKEKLTNAFKVYAADFVTTTDGTGMVHTAVMYGADDFDLGTKYNLPKFHLVNEEGKFISGTGFLEGRYVKEKNEKGEEVLAIDIIKDLASRGLLFKKEKHEHSYPHCWRCDTPLIYYARTSWYFRMSALREQLLAANETINWEPKHIKEGRFGEWLDGIKDWAISRDRYWGTPLPIWATEDGSQKVVIGSLDDVKKYAKKSGNKYIVMRHGESESNILDICSGNPENNHPLTEKGRGQVMESAQALKQKGITKIFTSPNLRARQTGEIVADTIGLSKDAVVIDNRIMEIQYGDFEGKSFSGDFVRYRDTVMKTMDDSLPNGDSFQKIKNRLGDFIYEINDREKNEVILIVAHGIVSELLPSVALGLDAVQSRNTIPHTTLKKGSFLELEFSLLPHNEHYELDFHKPFIDELQLELDGQKLLRTPEVMDVWFDSGSMPYAQDHVLGEAINFVPTPADYISEGVDQTRGWFYTLHAVANMMNDKPTVAYKNVVCLGLILDAQGQKMSKSRGNVVNPWDMFNKYGADVLRFWMYSINQPGESKNFDEKTVDEVNKKVFNLLRNVAKFYEMYGAEQVVVNYRESQNVLDRWVIAKTDELVANVTTALDSYKMMEASRAIREYTADLSQWYIRRSRDRFKSDDATDRAYALATTRAVLLDIAKLMAPFAPFFAEELYQSLRTETDLISVHLCDWPIIVVADQAVLADMEVVRGLVTRALEARAQAGVKIRQPLQSVTLSIKLDGEYEVILADELNVKEILHDPDLSEGEVKLDTTITEELKKEGQYREFVRGIQDLRKTMGLQPGDKVILLVDASTEGVALVQSYKDDLMKAAGIVDIEMGQGTHGIIVDDMTFKVSLVM